MADVPEEQRAFALELRDIADRILSGDLEVIESVRGGGGVSVYPDPVSAEVMNYKFTVQRKAATENGE